MTITARYWERKSGTFDPDYNKRYTHLFSGKSAADCMEQYRRFSDCHDVVRYTSAEIIDVED